MLPSLACTTRVYSPFAEVSRAPGARIWPSLIRSPDGGVPEPPPQTGFGPPVPVRPPGRTHCWAVVLLKVYSWSWTPSTLLPPGSSRHSPDCTFSSELPTCRHCWLALPSHCHRYTLLNRTPGTAPWTSRHRSFISSMPFDHIV